MKIKGDAGNLMVQNKKSNSSFKFSVIAAVLILINGAGLAVVTKWLPGFMPTLPGSTGNDPFLMYSLATLGLVLGALVFLGALMLRSMPSHRKALGLMVIAFSVPSIVMGGGLIVGFILGIIGGTSAFRENSVATKP